MMSLEKYPNQEYCEVIPAPVEGQEEQRTILYLTNMFCIRPFRVLKCLQGMGKLFSVHTMRDISHFIS